MTKQVLSIEQMKNLSKLMPLKENTDFIWWGKGEGIDPEQYRWELHCSDTADANPQCDWIYPAYTLQDILDILPSEIVYLHTRRFLCIDMVEQYICYYTDTCDRKLPVRIFDFRNGKPLIDAAYTAFIWCIRKGFINPRKEEHP